MDAFGLAQQYVPGPIQDFGGAALGKFHNFLAALERAGLYGLGLTDTVDYAVNRPKELGYTEDHRGSGDALRHILLAAELQRTHPYLAKPLLYGHEFVTNMLQSQPAEEREQDLANNEIGFGIAKEAQSRQDVERLAQERLGKAVVLPTTYDQYR